MQVILRAALAAALIGGLAAPAHAILVLESVYKASEMGLSKDLAAQPQFGSVIDFMGAGESGNRATGVWIGNDDTHGYILTAAHNFCDGGKATDFDYMTVDLFAYVGAKVTMHPEYICGSFSRMGFDFAIVELTEKADIETQAVLYDGDDELEKVLTFVGYGRRGNGVEGSLEPADQVAAAAQAVISAIAVAPDELPSDPEADAGNFLITDFIGEEGISNPDSGTVTKPVSDYAGSLASGDSGGPAYIEVNGVWYVAGINQSGSGETYGATSHFARVTHVKDWILSIYPDAKFGS